MSALDIPARQKSRAWLRPGALCFLGLAEFAVLDSLYDVRIVGGGADVSWLAANFVVKLAAYAAFYALVALGLMMWPRRAGLATAWSEAQKTPRRSVAWIGLNLAIFAGLALATPQLQHT